MSNDGSSQVTFIYIALFTKQISKQLSTSVN